jgi:VanZ family protein
VIVVMSLVPATDLPDMGISYNFGHAMGYGLLTFWFAGAYRHWPLAAIAAACFALGMTLEGVQAFTTTRAPELGDLAANLAGIAVAVGVAAAGCRQWCAIVEDYLQRRLLP